MITDRTGSGPGGTGEGARVRRRAVVNSTTESDGESTAGRDGDAAATAPLVPSGPTRVSDGRGKGYHPRTSRNGVTAMSSPTFAAATALLQLPGPLDSTLGTVFLALAGFLVVLFVGRIVLRIAWRLALIAAFAVGVFLIVTTYLV